jgi:hypothetical protein
MKFSGFGTGKKLESPRGSSTYRSGSSGAKPRDKEHLSRDLIPNLVNLIRFHAREFVAIFGFQFIRIVFSARN